MSTLNALIVLSLILNISPQPTGRWWIFYTPQPLTPTELRERRESVAQQLTRRSLLRRSKTIPYDPPVRLCDLGPSPEQLEAIRIAGCRIVVVARYVNAISVEGSDRALREVSQLPWVTSVRPVYAFPNERDRDRGMIEHERSRYLSGDRISDSTFYGRSWVQMSMVNVPVAHQEGFMGNGVLVGVQDAGFDRLNHRAFQRLRVVATWDFLNNDPEVGDEGDRGSGRHGTRTLSLLAGWDPGNFVGVAPLAHYVLTKTEDTDGEYRAEEDFWVAGLWFHDSLGVEVISSSLSYRDWYEYADMDGATALVSRAADSAAAAGIVIVNSMGNTGQEEYPHNKMGAPADARGVISAGGVRRDSSYWPFASQGPTFDGRIKPDLSALASMVTTASSLHDSAYTMASGTSFSCPVIAGIAALILEVAPHLTPSQVRAILCQTASYADHPDTLVGWGVPNAGRAVHLAAQNASWERNSPPLFSLYAFPNPFNGSVWVRTSPEVRFGEIAIYDLWGRRVYPQAEKIGSGWWRFEFIHLPTGQYFFQVRRPTPLPPVALILIR